MKTAVSILLSVCLCLSLLTLAACGRYPEENGPVGESVGGWTVPTDFGEAAIPEEARAAFDKAMEGYDGVGLVPVAYLGSQVVAGVNYSFLCSSTSFLAKPVVSLSLVTVYRALDGSAKISDVVKLNLSKLGDNDGDVEFDPAGMAGGFYLGDAVGPALPEEAQTAFDKVSAGLLGVNYEPLALLATQVVSGVNYAILCRATTVTAEPASALAIMTVYADTQGNAEILNIGPFPA